MSTASHPARTLDAAPRRGDQHHAASNGHPVRRTVYVVGAGRGRLDVQSVLDRGRAVALRAVDARVAAGGRTQDIRFEKYVPHAGGWVAEEVRILVGGAMVFREEYSNVRVNVRLDDDLFIPEKWSYGKALVHTVTDAIDATSFTPEPR